MHWMNRLVTMDFTLISWFRVLGDGFWPESELFTMFMFGYETLWLLGFVSFVKKNVLYIAVVWHTASACKCWVRGGDETVARCSEFVG